jgi:DNA modification methylase
MDKKATDYIPDPANANQGTERGVYMVEESLQKTGAGRSIVVDKNGTVIAGNKTLQGAIDSGIVDVVEVETQGDKLVVVKRTDLDLSSDDDRARLLAYYDNRASEVGLDWDAEQLLADLNAGIDLSGVFMDDELERLLAGLRADINDDGGSVDEAKLLQERWDTKLGQVWEVGHHRIMCGDSTNQDCVTALLDGSIPNIMVTDPPYGVEYDANWRNEAASAGLLSRAKRRTGDVQHDDRVDWSDAYRLFPGNIAYMWSPPGDHIIVTGQSVLNSGFVIRNQIIWRKPHYPISRGHYTYQHEPCWYAVKKGQKASWCGPTNESTVWEIALDKNVEGGHSTQKPLECMARPIRNHLGDVYDPFVGSGTTIVAAHQEMRKCYAMDIDPAYVAVTLERLVGVGLSPKMVGVVDFV